jgi:hypothetical protein
MKDPRQIILNQVKFHEDLETISYDYTLDDQRRIVSYRFDGDRSVRVGVREKASGAPFIELRASRDGIRARTPEGEIKLVKGEWVLPPATDEPSVWLLVQDPVKNPTLTPVLLYDRFWESPRPPGSPDGEESSAWTGTVTGLPGSIWALIQLWEWLGGSSGDCLNPGQETQCTEVDVDGNPSVVTFRCDCGMPFCNEVSIPISVQVTLVDESGNVLGTENQIRETVQCACYCMEVVISTGGSR